MRELFAGTNRSPGLDRGDKRLMWLMTLVFTIFTLCNLGTLRFPQTVWNASGGQSVILDLGQEKSVSAIWFNGNIADGAMTITADDGSTY